MIQLVQCVEQKMYLQPPYCLCLFTDQRISENAMHIFQPKHYNNTCQYSKKGETPQGFVTKLRVQHVMCRLGAH